MYDVVKLLIEFAVVFVIVYIIFFVFNIKNRKKYDRQKAPVNIKYLVLKYNLDVVRIGYKKLLNTLNFIDSIIVATLFTVTRFIDNTIIRLVVAFILVFPLFAGIYHLVAMHYKKESEYNGI